MISAEQRFALYDLYAQYASTADACRYDDWLALFAPTCSYRIIPRENHVAGLPLCLILCESRDMLVDRIVALQQANEYAIHVDRHVITGIRVTQAHGDLLRVEADFLVGQTDSEGELSLYVMGTYQDTVQISGARALFVGKTVIVDNACIPHAISTPI
jgi:3-phenylpropionate/cinnamic acid dioxygenase small subunit